MTRRAFRGPGSWLLFGFGAIGGVVSTLLFPLIVVGAVEGEFTLLEAAMLMPGCLTGSALGVWGIPAPWRYGVFFLEDRVVIRQPRHPRLEIPLDEAQSFLGHCRPGLAGMAVVLLDSQGEEHETGRVEVRVGRLTRALNEALTHAQREYAP